MGTSRIVMPRTRLILRPVTTGALCCKTPGPPLRKKTPGPGLQSALMLARLTISLQIFCSLKMKEANSDEGPPPPTALSEAKRSVTADDLSALRDSSCSRFTTSGGVPAGARMPYH